MSICKIEELQLTSFKILDQLPIAITNRARRKTLRDAGCSVDNANRGRPVENRHECTVSQRYQADFPSTMLKWSRTLTPVAAQVSSGRNQLLMTGVSTDTLQA